MKDILEKLLKRLKELQVDFGSEATCKYESYQKCIDEVQKEIDKCENHVG